MPLLRRLNQVGIQRMECFLGSLKTETPHGIPEEILFCPETSQDVGVAIEVDRGTFGNRLEAARYLDGKLSGSGLSNIERDTGLWAWLTLFYFDELCPADVQSRRHPREYAPYP